MDDGATGGGNTPSTHGASGGVDVAYKVQSSDGDNLGDNKDRLKKVMEEVNISAFINPKV